jgi:hypothetical protein
LNYLNTPRHLLITLSLLFFGKVMATESPLDADNVDQALTMVAMRIRHIETVQRECAALIPAARAKIQRNTLLWHDQNINESLAIYAYLRKKPIGVDAIIEAANSTGNLAFKALPTEQQKAYCINLFVTIPDHQQDVVTKTPRASRYLTEYTAKNPISMDDLFRYNTLQGCMKAIFNKSLTTKSNFDLDEANRTCTCLTDVTVGNTTAAERRAVTESQLKDNVKPAYLTRIAPKLASCFEPAK